MTRKRHFDVYAASCAPDGGIFRYSLSSEGKLTPVSSLTLDRPMYFQKLANSLHIILRAPDGFGGSSAYLCCHADATEADVQKAVSTEGTVSCHLCVIDTDVYTANYLSGSVSRIGKKLVTHVPPQQMRVGRQDAPHTHCVIPSPDKKYLLCTDLGLDKIFVYTRALEFVSCAAVPDAHGARHITFGPDGRYLYCVNELASTVSVFGYKNGILTYISTYDCGIKSKNNLAAAIRLSHDGTRMFVSQRGEDCISVFEVCGEKLTLKGNYPSYGSSPRDIYLTPDDRFLLCANESGAITVLETKSMSLCDTVAIPCALCVYAE